MDLGLKDKVAVITGGSIGIGLAVANGLAAEGVNLALCARGDERVMGADQRSIWHKGHRGQRRCQQVGGHR
jgi:NAD(P)-dependent dehydrogenase (short-subunit alcohol dehydrogenase family)